MGGNSRSSYLHGAPAMHSSPSAVIQHSLPANLETPPAPPSPPPSPPAPLSSSPPRPPPSPPPPPPPEEDDYYDEVELENLREEAEVLAQTLNSNEPEPPPPPPPSIQPETFSGLPRPSRLAVSSQIETIIQAKQSPKSSSFYLPPTNPEMPKSSVAPKGRPVSKRVFQEEKGNKSQIVKQGYLAKKGAKRRNWKTRWFILKKDELVYFKDPFDKDPAGCISMKQANVYISDHKAHCFCIDTGSRKYLIAAKNSPSQREWIEAIRIVVNSTSKQNG